MTERRYEPILKLAAGGMATVFVGTARGAMGFRQLVALKQPHKHLLEDPLYRKELVAEARLASLIHHANVVDVRDIEIDGDEITLVMDYIEGASLSELLMIGLRGGPRVPPAVAIRIILDACAGLHAAHDIVDEKGRAVGLVHRDVSPQNILIGLDGTARVSDFGVAKLTSGQSTAHGTLKGKLAYMAPEYLRNERVDRRLDVFALGVVLWEALAYDRLFRGQHDADTLRKVLEHRAPRLSEVAPELGTELDSVVETALAKDRDARFQSALAFATALEASARRAGLVASHAEVAEVVRSMMGAPIEERRQAIRKKMAEEPSLLSFMKSDAPPEVAALNRPNPDLIATVAPATKPTMDTLPIDQPTPPPAVTLPLAQPTGSRPALAASQPSIPPHEEPSRPFDPMSISQLPSTPKRSLAVPVTIVVALVVVLGGVATWTATRSSEPSPTTTPSITSTPTVAASASSAASTASASAASSALAPLTTKPLPHGTHAAPHSSTTGTVPPKPTGTDDPPPNPY